MANGKKKILHVTFDMAIGGTEQVIRQIVENTDTNRFDAEVLCIDGKSGTIGQLLSDNGHKVTVFKRKTNGVDFDIVKQIRRYLKSEAIDIIHCHQYTPYFYGALAAVGTRATVMLTEHGRFYPDLYNWKRALVNPILNLWTKYVVSISKATAEALVKIENFPRRSVTVIYNGIRDVYQPFAATEVEALKREMGVEPDELLLGTISRLDPIKNHKMMLKAFELVLKDHPKAKLLLVGDGPLRAETEQWAKEYGVYEKVIFTGFKTEPLAYFNLIDVFLLPSLSEGTSMTLLEAMAYSKPCVVTDVGGNPEIVLDNNTGLVTPNDDAESLSNAILQLLKDDEARKRMGEAGRKRYEDTFSVKQMVDSYQAMYSNC